VTTNFTIIRDTREKDGKGWNFRASTGCDGMETTALKTGDYAIRGLENLVVIERKGSIGEVVTNVTTDLPRFERELVRLEADVAHPFILIEANLEDLVGWPRTSGLSQRVRSRIKTTGSYILKIITGLMLKYPRIRWVFCGADGQKLALSIFKRAFEAATPAEKAVAGGEAPVGKKSTRKKATPGS